MSVVDNGLFVVKKQLFTSFSMVMLTELLGTIQLSRGNIKDKTKGKMMLN